MELHDTLQGSSSTSLIALKEIVGAAAHEKVPKGKSHCHTKRSMRVCIVGPSSNVYGAYGVAVLYKYKYFLSMTMTQDLNDLFV